MTPNQPMRRGADTTRRWIYVLGGLVVALAVALGVVLATRDDDSDSSSSTTTSSSTSTSAPTTTTSPPTTAPPTTAPATTIPLPPLQNDPQSYAMYLYVAWVDNNRQAAATVASPDAVNQMFAEAYQPVQTSSGPVNPWQFQTCDPAAGSVYCTWNGQNGTKIVMMVRNLTGGLPILVTQVQRQ